MRKPKAICLLLFCFFGFSAIEVFADIGIGTATSYGPPYLPTQCLGVQLPGSGYFVAAGDGIWDNGAACGRRYKIWCISGPRQPCKSGTIVVQVVDYCRSNPCKETMVLSIKALAAISINNGPNSRINVGYAEI